MYAKFSAGGLLAFSVAALPAQEPTLRVARILLEITGFGFGLYCLVALLLPLAGLWLRATARRQGVTARRRVPGQVEGS